MRESVITSEERRGEESEVAEGQMERNRRRVRSEWLGGEGGRRGMKRHRQTDRS